MGVPTATLPGAAANLCGPRGSRLAPPAIHCLLTRHVPDASGASFQPFVRDVIAQGATLRTDGWTGYNGPLRYGYVHERTVLSSSGDPAHVSMPGVHRRRRPPQTLDPGHASGLCHPGPPAVLPGGVHLRFNRRSSGSRGLIFRRLVEQAVVAGPLTDYPPSRNTLRMFGDQ